MLRKTLLALGVAALCGLSIQIGGRAEAAASYFTVNQACGTSGIGVDTTVQWQGMNPAASQVYVDLSEYNNGWVPDTYASSGALSPNQSSFLWVSLVPNTTYYVRVNTGVWTGQWLPTDWVRFDTPGYSGPNCYQPYGSYAQPYVVPNVITCPPPGGGTNVNIWVDKGEGGRYHVGDSIRVCYSVSQPMYVQIIDYMSDGQQNNLRSGYDDGRGGCFLAQVTPPRGREHITIYGQGGSSDTVNFRVVR